MSKSKILFAGHDLKFLKHIIRHYSNHEKYTAEVIQYNGHVIKNHHNLVETALGSDIIFCEWGLGNLSWLSHNKFPDQKIVVRIHLQEFSTDYLDHTDWHSVSKIILVGPKMYQRFENRFPDQIHKAHVIYNVVDTDSFDKTKAIETGFNLGLLGVLPKRKAPHQALEILEKLRQTDRKYKLYIKGNKPQEIEWLWRKEEERKYYTEFSEKISQMGLQDVVIWEEHGSDVQEWFQKIGFILSTSEFESFHMAVAEGMASGSIPVIYNWEGADLVYPAKYIVRNLEEAVDLILKHNMGVSDNTEIQNLKNYAREHFGLEDILSKYDNMFDQLVADQPITNKSTLRNQCNLLLNEKTSEVSGLNDKVSYLNNEVSHLNNEVSGLKNEVSGLNREISDLTKITEGFRELVAEQSEDISNKERIIQTLNNRIAVDENHIASLNQTNLMQQTVTIELNSDINKLKTDVESLNSQIEKLKIVLNKRNEKIVELQKYIQYLEKKFLNKVLHFLQKQYRHIKNRI